LYITPVAASAQGICTQLLQVGLNCESGASLAPKSTCLFVIAETPPPEPIAL